MAKPNPFAGKKAPPFGGKGGKGGKLKEGSRAEEALDRQQDMGGFRRGGKVKKK
jgi:hypothetical protein